MESAAQTQPCALLKQLLVLLYLPSLELQKPPPPRSQNPFDKQHLGWLERGAFALYPPSICLSTRQVWDGRRRGGDGDPGRALLSRWPFNIRFSPDPLLTFSVWQRLAWGCASSWWSFSLRVLKGKPHRGADTLLWDPLSKDPVLWTVFCKIKQQDASPQQRIQ